MVGLKNVKMPISYFSQHICSYEEAFEAILPNLKQYQHFVQDASEKEVDGIIKSTKTYEQFILGRFNCLS